jgi:DNA modification methylase
VKPPMPRVIHGDARHRPLPDETVDLVVTSPPYFGLRDYGSDQQIGAEPTPQEFIAALIECTREMMRVLKPGGSIFVNLGDKYATRYSSTRGGGRAGLNDDDDTRSRSGQNRTGTPEKSLLLLPERYRIAAVDELGLIARAVIIWDKPNGLPESVTDRVRRSHEDWVHLTKSPRYFSAVDEIREPHDQRYAQRRLSPQMPRAQGNPDGKGGWTGALRTEKDVTGHPLGKLPGSVWTIPTQPLKVPSSLGVDHFAAFPMELPRQLIQGWSPQHVCTACGEGRRPVSAAQRTFNGQPVDDAPAIFGADGKHSDVGRGGHWRWGTDRAITGYACACPDTTAPTTPGVVLDPFSGTGTTALVAAMLGRHGVGVELNPDYIRLAQWRASDAKERARAAGLDPDAVAAVKTELPGQESLLDLLDGEPA